MLSFKTTDHEHKGVAPWKHHCAIPVAKLTLEVLPRWRNGFASALRYQGTMFQTSGSVKILLDSTNLEINNPNAKAIRSMDPSCTLQPSPTILLAVCVSIVIGAWFIRIVEMVNRTNRPSVNI